MVRRSISFASHAPHICVQQYALICVKLIWMLCICLSRISDASYLCYTLRPNNVEHKIITSWWMKYFHTVRKISLYIEYLGLTITCTYISLIWQLLRAIKVWATVECLFSTHPLWDETLQQSSTWPSHGSWVLSTTYLDPYYHIHIACFDHCILLTCLFDPCMSRSLVETWLLPCSIWDPCYSWCLCWESHVDQLFFT